MNFLRRTILFMFATIFLIWFLFATVRTVFNITKLFTEEKKWLFLSQEKKKEQAYGTVYDFYTFVEKTIPTNAKVLFFTDAKSFYLGRYTLYPRKFWFASTTQQTNEAIKSKEFDFFLIYTEKKMLRSDKQLSKWQQHHKPSAVYEKQHMRGEVYRL